ncbi:helix-turn-helix transcriptional regulator [Candidatus Leptofilum sp.]|uniref:helix-turn-helix transcriptional regulator n=1 Tax=Candidatus Leptofilum sp. TaxID=3241576 RepID=UPI003B5C9255
MELQERVDALNILNEAWQTAVAGNGRIALISGEAGIGKTTLVEQFVSQHGQLRVLWGACDNLFTPRPLGPLHDIAGQAKGQLELLLQSDKDRSAIFSACLSELQSPTVIVFEDIHWADEATLDLLKYLGRRIQYTCSLLITTYRDDALGSHHPLRLLLGDLVRQSAVSRLGLAPLSLTAVRQLAQNYPGDVEKLHQQTGGNPFFINQVLTSDEDGIPATVREVVLARASRLSLSGRAVLDAAAVIGQRIEPWLLTEVVQAEADAVQASLELGILLPKGDNFVFRHELARQIILDEILPHQRTFLHQAVLDVLKTSPLAQKDAARLAHHAASADNSEEILNFGRKAGFEAAQMGMHRAAKAWFELTLPFADSLQLGEQMDLYENYALHIQSTDLAKSIEAFEKLAELAEIADEPVQQGLAWGRAAVVHYRLGQLEVCDALLHRAITILEPFSPNHGLVSAYPLIAMRQHAQGHAEPALAYAEKGHQMALELGKIRDILQAYQVVGLCTMPLDRAKGLYHLETCLQMAIEHKQFRIAGSNYANLIMYTLDLFPTKPVAKLITEAKSYQIEHDLDFSLAMTQAWEAINLLYQGHWSASEAVSDAVLQKATAPIARIPALIAQSRLATRRGHVAVAEEPLNEALVLSKKVNNLTRIGIYYCTAAEAAWLAGNEAEIHRLLAEYYDTAVQYKLPGFAAEMAYWGWRVGELVEAFDWMHQPFILEIEGNWQAAADAWGALGCPYEQARALADGDKDAQKAALLIFEQLGARPMAKTVRQKLRDAGVQTIPRGARASTKENPFNLTNRQLEILSLLTDDLTNAEIAARLHISPKTVDHHVSAVLGKLQVSSRTEAAEIGRQHHSIF